MLSPNSNPYLDPNPNPNHAAHVEAQEEGERRAAQVRHVTLTPILTLTLTPSTQPWLCCPRGGTQAGRGTCRSGANSIVQRLESRGWILV